MDVIKLVKIGLENGGFGGLFEAGICACKVDDLSPGNCLTERCEAGYVHTHSVSGDWVISAEREPISDDRINEILRDC